MGFQRKTELGAALVELALMLPLFMVLLSGTLDLSKIVTLKLKLSRVAYEGSRLAGEFRGLEIGGCSTSVSGCVAQQHQELHKKIRSIINSYPELAKIQINVVTLHTKNEDAASSEQAETVSVSLSAAYSPTLFPGTISVGAEVHGPYLLNDSKTGG